MQNVQALRACNSCAAHSEIRAQASASRTRSTTSPIRICPAALGPNASPASTETPYPSSKRSANACAPSPVWRTSTITKIVEKSGAAGPMVLLTMAHEVRANGVVAMREEQDLAFIAIAERFTPPAPVPLPPCDWREAIAIDPVMLFRFSALTFNGHRIHYDLSYATEVERYPGLVVHGPLQAILLFDAALRRGPKGARPAHLQFRGMRPLFDFDAITLNGRTDENGELHLYTANGEDLIGMQARVRWTTA